MNLAKEKVIRFVRESNEIESIFRDPTEAEIAAHIGLWEKDHLTIDDITDFVYTVANGAPLRTRDDLSVSIGTHIPPRGGPLIVEYLNAWLERVQNDPIGWNPFDAHVEYEALHPYMDGNGRSGRALWAWHMMELGKDPFCVRTLDNREKWLPFLQRWYYASLEAMR